MRAGYPSQDGPAVGLRGKLSGSGFRLGRWDGNRPGRAEQLGQHGGEIGLWIGIRERKMAFRPKAKGGREFPFLFSKPISKQILNANLNQFEIQFQTTQYKNNMQQHECINM